MHMHRMHAKSYNLHSGSNADEMPTVSTTASEMHLHRRDDTWDAGVEADGRAYGAISVDIASTVHAAGAVHNQSGGGGGGAGDMPGGATSAAIPPSISSIGPAASARAARHMHVHDTRGPTGGESAAHVDVNSAGGAGHSVWRELLDGAAALQHTFALQDAERRKAVAKLEVQAIHSGRADSDVARYVTDVRALLPEPGNGWGNGGTYGEKAAEAAAVANLVDELIGIEHEIQDAAAQRKELEEYLAVASQQDVNTRRSAREESALKIMTRRVTEIELQHQKTKQGRPHEYAASASFHSHHGGRVGAWDGAYAV